MGQAWGQLTKILGRISSRALSSAPIMFARQDDYTAAGTARSRIRYVWGLIMKSMITLDLPTRRFLYPIIKHRIDRIEASQKYTTANMMSLMEAYDGWDEQKLFDLHDLFQVFEVDGDGLIDISEMCVGLDNLGDHTPEQERLLELATVDEDGTGSIDFEEFLQVLYNLEHRDDVSVTLGETFRVADGNVKFIRHMSIIQQLRSGLL